MVDNSVGGWNANLDWLELVSQMVGTPSRTFTSGAEARVYCGSTGKAEAVPPQKSIYETSSKC
jgi:hypothetical protein